MSTIPLPAPADTARRLADLVARARTRARAAGRPVLASATERIGAVDLLSALEAASAEPGLEPLRAGLRMFWSHGSGGLALAGFGAAVELASGGGDARFLRADGAWRALLADAVVDGDSHAAATGPLLLGGFAFDPDGPRTGLWNGFPAAGLAVPALLLTASADACHLTLSTLVAPDGAPSVEVDLLLQGRRAMLGTAPGARGGPPAGESDRAHPPAPHRFAAPDVAFHDATPATEWRELVAEAVAEIRAGRMAKVVLARAVHATAPADLSATALLRHLRAAHRDAYVFGCWRGDRVFLGASPERLVRLADGVVETSSLAGSARRGDDPREDATLAAALLASAKDRAEHAMVRRALGDALATMCDDVSAPDGPSLLTLPHVHHLHTAVRARLRAGHSLLDVVAALHPTPAVGGDPREPALAFLRVREPLDRGWYAAPIGWIGRDAGELAVGLRSALVHGREATLFAGCGIVADSDPERELAESRLKLRPMQSALAATLAWPTHASAAPDDATLAVAATSVRAG